MTRKLIVVGAQFGDINASKAGFQGFPFGKFRGLVSSEGIVEVIEAVTAIVIPPTNGDAQMTHLGPTRLATGFDGMESLKRLTHEAAGPRGFMDRQQLLETVADIVVWGCGETRP